jgi:hypothetical protein
MKKSKYKNERSADGVNGILIFSMFDNKPLFRIYDKKYEDGFKDFEIFHDDVSITINDPLASFYDIDEETSILDHPSQVLGIEVEQTEFCLKCNALLMVHGDEIYCPRCVEEEK